MVMRNGRTVIWDDEAQDWVPKPLDGPCTSNGYEVGVPFSFLFRGCPDCGHAKLVHPGLHNPAVESCVLCRMEGMLGTVD